MGRRFNRAPKKFEKSPDGSRNDSDDVNEDDVNEEQADGAASRHLECGHQGCSYRTNRMSNLTRHRNGKHAALAKPQGCCDQVFLDRFSLDRHRNLVHRIIAGGTPSYRCRMCGGSFSRRGLLARHMSVHNGLRPFACRCCTYSSSHKSNLERHEAAKHGIVKTIRGQAPDVSGTDSDKDSGIGTGESGRSWVSSGESGDETARFLRRGGMEAGRKPLKRQGPGCPARNLRCISKDQIQKALVVAVPEKPKPFPNRDWSISAIDLQEAGPSGMQGNQPAAQAMRPQTSGHQDPDYEPPPGITPMVRPEMTWNDADENTREAAMGLLMLSTPMIIAPKGRQEDGSYDY